MLSELAKRVGATAILAVVLLAGCESKEQRFRPVNLSGGKLLPGRPHRPGQSSSWRRGPANWWKPARWKSGDVYSFAVDSTVRARELGDILGISLARTQFLLYFEPGNREQPTERARLMGKR